MYTCVYIPLVSTLSILNIMMLNSNFNRVKLRKRKRPYYKRVFLGSIVAGNNNNFGGITFVQTHISDNKSGFFLLAESFCC